MQSCLYSTAKPAKPTLASNNGNATDGEEITLVCHSSTQGVNKYVFKGPSVDVTRSVNSYTIGHATIGVHDGDYSCTALIDTIASVESNIVHVSCRFHCCYVLWTICRILSPYLIRLFGFIWGVSVWFCIASLKVDRGSIPCRQKRLVITIRSTRCRGC